MSNLRTKRRWSIASAVGCLAVLAALLVDRSLLTPERVAAALMVPGRGVIPAGEPAPDTFGLPAVPFTVRTTDNVDLAGWYVPAADPARLTVVVCHGVGSNHWGAIGLAQTLHDAGDLDVVLFDFRAHGVSGGELYTYGAHERRDVSAIVAWARERTAGRPLALVGWSAGAATALLYAADDPSVDRVVAINSFADMTEMASRRRPFFVRASVYADALRVAQERARFRMSDVSPLRAASRIHVPVFLIVGEDDDTVPPAHTHRLAAALGGRARLWALPGIGHDDWWRPSDFGPRVVSFLREPL
ncbi:MAG: alpha/beta fold hydrolase [Myxococcota bacterium]|nr:alpha/beta fold hydrolase [Myxococcota bacterium]